MDPRHAASRATWAGILALALFVRALWIPAFTRHTWVPHESGYLEIFEGRWSDGWSTRMVPSLGTWNALLGRVFDDGRVLLVQAQVLGLISLFAFLLLLRRLAGPRPALLGGLLVALYGNHAFWSSSAYNVIAPHALLLLGLAALTWPGGAAVVVGGLLLGAAAGARVEVGLLLPAAALALGRGGRRWLLAALGGAAAWLPSVLPLVEPRAHPADLLGQIPAALAWNLWPPLFWAPWDRLATLLPALALGAFGAWRWRRAGALLFALLLLDHLTVAAFADSGFRHALAGGVALCGLQALGLAALLACAGERAGLARAAGRAAVLLLLLGVVALELRQTARVADRYYASPARLAAELEAACPRHVAERDLAGCQELIDLPGDPPTGALHTEADLDQGCWYWAEEWLDRRWGSFGDQDRALRMHRALRLEPLGIQRNSGHPEEAPRLFWRVLGKRGAPGSGPRSAAGG